MIITALLKTCEADETKQKHVLEKKAVKDCTKNPITTPITGYDVTYRPKSVVQSK